MIDAYNAASVLYTARCTDTVSLQALYFLTTAGQYTSGSPHDATSVCLVHMLGYILLVCFLTQFISWVKLTGIVMACCKC